MQVFDLLPASVTPFAGSSRGNTTTASSSFRGLDALVANSDMPGALATVLGSGALRLDFGVEFAGWLELDSPDLQHALANGTSDVQIWLGCSEDNQPHPQKTLTPVRHGQTLFRLETNWLLYEGVRFGFLFVNMSASSRPWHIAALRGVAQTLPVRYAASFESVGDDELTRVWWTGAYCPKLNMGGPPIPGALPPSTQMLNAILVDRGDRYGWTGDDHVAQGAILTAFGPARHEFVRQSLWNTHNDSNAVPSFGLMWCLSVLDYYDASDDGDTLRLYARNVDAKVRASAAVEGSASGWGERGHWVPPSMDFLGWDERLGSGFEFATPSNETQRLFSMLTARTARDFARALRHLNASELLPMAAAHERIYERIKTATTVSSGGERTPWARFGMHAAAEAIIAGIASPDAYGEILARSFANRAQICSWAPYNQWWVLRGLAQLSLPKAIEAVRLCWGGQIRLGASTFWEAFAPDWVASFAPDEPTPGFANGPTSKCHPYASGVTTWMTQALLGVNRDAPGHGEWSLRPMPAPVRGDVETVHGAIHVAWRGDLLRVTIPRGTTLREAALPIDCDSAVAASKTLVAINGRAPTPVPVEAMGRATGRPWCHAIALRNQTAPPDRAVELEVKLLTATLPDLAHIATDAGGMGGMGGQPHGHAQRMDPSEFLARWLPEDGTTGGDWRGKYGTLGHALFSPLADGVDEVDLPAGVALSTNPFEPRVAPPWHPEHGSLLFTPGVPGCALQTSTAPPRRGLGTAVNINGSNPYNAYLDVDLGEMMLQQSGPPAAAMANASPGGRGKYVLSLYFCDAYAPHIAAAGFVERRQFGVVPTALNIAPSSRDAGGGANVTISERGRAPGAARARGGL